MYIILNRSDHNSVQKFLKSLAIRPFRFTPLMEVLKTDIVQIREKVESVENRGSHARIQSTSLSNRIKLYNRELSDIFAIK